MPHAVLDVVAEDPEIEHVADEMHPAAVQEHRGEDRRGRRHERTSGGSWSKPKQHRGHEPEGIAEQHLATRTMQDLPQEHDDTHADEREVDEGFEAERGCRRGAGIIDCAWLQEALSRFPAARHWNRVTLAATFNSCDQASSCSRKRRIASINLRYAADGRRCVGRGPSSGALPPSCSSSWNWRAIAFAPTVFAFVFRLCA